MGSRVNICKVDVLDNPAKFTDKIRLEITFEVFEHLPHDLEWEVVYVGSESKQHDQILDSILVGPIPEGRHQFVFETKAPAAEKIPIADIVGVTVLLLKCRYNNKEFINLGWFVSNEYTDEDLRENSPGKPLIEKLLRTVKTDDLRVTTYAIQWDEKEPEFPPEEEETSAGIDQDLMPENDEYDEDEHEEEEEDAPEIDLNVSGEATAGEEAMEEEEAKVDDNATGDKVTEPLADVTNG